MQRSFTLLLCLIDFKAEQKERDDRVVTCASRQIGARHRIPRFVVPTSDKITRLGILMCAFWATLTNHFDLQTRLFSVRPVSPKLNHGSRNNPGNFVIIDRDPPRFVSLAFACAVRRPS